ncbi:hypothetical protein BDB01DRAFT_26550 [Pilobolus umbonatus]|nr:hypothetical protein BDB01DRAFT_26550 [Pilobolus umbonatus]
MPRSRRFSVIPLSLIQGSPQVKNLEHGTYCVTQNSSLTDINRVYHEYSTYVGLRLDQVSEKSANGLMPIGLLYIMNDTPLEKDKIDFILTILSKVKLRTTREIERLRQRDNLMIVKNAALQDAENKIKFLADMSHEIRTPMNAVIALTDLLLQERSTLDAEQAEYLEVIQTSGNHLLTVVNDILDISKINHDPKFKLENRRFSLRKCVKDALNMARHQASMSQHNRTICLVEFPSDVNDNLPILDLIKELTELGRLPASFMQSSSKSPLPLIWKIGSDVPDLLLGDTMRLTQILINLCSNAVKFTKKGGICVRIMRYVPTPHRSATDDTQSKMSFKERYEAKIESIYTRVMRKESKSYQDEDSSGGASVTDDEREREDDKVEEEKVILEISVTDTGIGIPANRLPRLFKSFSQIDISTARRYGGTGLGLAISSMLVNRMGGGLWVESEEGVGSRFALTLPLSVASGRRKSDGRHSFNGSVNTSFPSPGSTTSDGSSTGEYTNDTPSSAAYASDTSSSSAHHHSSSINYFSSQQSPAGNYQKQKHNSNNEHIYYNSRNNNPNDYAHDTKGYPSSMTSKNNTAYSSLGRDAGNSSSSHTQTPELRNMLTRSNTADNNNEDSTGSSHSNIPNKSLVSTDKSRAANKSSSRNIVAKHYNQKRSGGDNEESLGSTNPMKILLAEDNDLNQKIAISILKRLGYTDVTVAGNGREVIEKMRKSPFDVIFMDLYMPEMDGLEATRYIVNERRSDKHGEASSLQNIDDVYIIALTASASMKDRRICIEAGMNDFISKPFTMTEMRSALKNCINSKRRD